MRRQPQRKFIAWPVRNLLFLYSHTCGHRALYRSNELNVGRIQSFPNQPRRCILASLGQRMIGAGQLPSHHSEPMRNLLLSIDDLRTQITEWGKHCSSWTLIHSSRYVLRRRQNHHGIRFQCGNTHIAHSRAKAAKISSETNSAMLPLQNSSKSYTKFFQTVMICCGLTHILHTLIQNINTRAVHIILVLHECSLLTAQGTHGRLTLTCVSAQLDSLSNQNPLRRNIFIVVAVEHKRTDTSVEDNRNTALCRSSERSTAAHSPSATSWCSSFVFVCFAHIMHSTVQHTIYIIYIYMSTLRTASRRVSSREHVGRCIRRV